MDHSPPLARAVCRLARHVSRTRCPRKAALEHGRERGMREVAELGQLHLGLDDRVGRILDCRLVCDCGPAGKWGFVDPDHRNRCLSVGRLSDVPADEGSDAERRRGCLSRCDRRCSKNCSIAWSAICAQPSAHGRRHGQNYLRSIRAGAISAKRPGSRIVKWPLTPCRRAIPRRFRIPGPRRSPAPLRESPQLARRFPHPTGLQPRRRRAARGYRG